MLIEVDGYYCDDARNAHPMEWMKVIAAFGMSLNSFLFYKYFYE